MNDSMKVPHLKPVRTLLRFLGGVRSFFFRFAVHRSGPWTERKTSSLQGDVVNWSASFRHFAVDHRPHRAVENNSIKATLPMITRKKQQRQQQQWEINLQEIDQRTPFLIGFFFQVFSAADEGPPERILPSPPRPPSSIINQRSFQRFLWIGLKFSGCPLCNPIYYDFPSRYLNE